MRLKFQRKPANFLNLRKKSKSKKKVTPKPRKKVIGGIKLAIFALCVLLGIFVLSKTVSGIASLFKPIDSNITGRQYPWDGKTSINIVFKGPSLWVLNYDPKKEKTVLLKIPKDTLIEVPYGYGSWLVGSIYNLGQEENPPIGGKLLKASLSNLLGLPIDGVIVTRRQDSEDLDELIDDFKTSPLSLLTFFSEFKSDLTPLEIIRLYQAISTTREDKIVNLDLENTDLTQSLLLPDSTRVLGFDTVNIDLFVRENMADETFLQEAKTIAIYNGTDHPGLGSRVSRIVTNLGADVVIVTNAEKNSKETLVLGEKTSSTFVKLAQIFATDCLKNDCQSKDAKISSSRADLSILIGEDYLESFF